VTAAALVVEEAVKLVVVETVKLVELEVVGVIVFERDVEVSVSLVLEVRVVGVKLVVLERSSVVMVVAGAICDTRSPDWLCTRSENERLKTNRSCRCRGRIRDGFSSRSCWPRARSSGSARSKDSSCRSSRVRRNSGCRRRRICHCRDTAASDGN
jgi:hypothetical protein